MTTNTNPKPTPGPDPRYVKAMRQERRKFDAIEKAMMLALTDDRLDVCEKAELILALGMIQRRDV